MNRTLLIAGMLTGLVLSGCSGATCEDACMKNAECSGLLLEGGRQAYQQQCERLCLEPTGRAGYYDCMVDSTCDQLAEGACDQS